MNHQALWPWWCGTHSVPRHTLCVYEGGEMCFHSCIYICIYISPPLTPKPAHPGAGMLVFTHPKGCHSQHPCTRPHGRAPVRPSPFRAVPRTSLCNPPRLGTCLNRAHVTHGPLDNAACMRYGLGGGYVLSHAHSVTPCTRPHPPCFVCNRSHALVLPMPLALHTRSRPAIRVEREREGVCVHMPIWCHATCTTTQALPPSGGYVFSQPCCHSHERPWFHVHLSPLQ